MQKFDPFCTGFNRLTISIKPKFWMELELANKTVFFVYPGGTVTMNNYQNKDKMAKEKIIWAQIVTFGNLQKSL